MSKETRVLTKEDTVLHITFNEVDGQPAVVVSDGSYRRVITDLHVVERLCDEAQAAVWAMTRAQVEADCTAEEGCKAEWGGHRDECPEHPFLGRTEQRLSSRK